MLQFLHTARGYNAKVLAELLNAKPREIKAYQTAQLGSQWITIAGQRALRVDYRNADGSESECTYIVWRGRTLQIDIGLNGSATGLFQEMLNTFRVTSTNR